MTVKATIRLTMSTPAGSLTAEWNPGGTIKITGASPLEGKRTRRKVGAFNYQSPTHRRMVRAFAAAETAFASSMAETGPSKE